MQTPIVDFVKKYVESNPVRFHMPGHKGQAFIGCEKYDITEVKGADELYAPVSIIKQSEANASKLFGTEMTLYSTEGSSQCIRAMLYLALANSEKKSKNRPYIVAARNVHKAFVYGAAMLDLDVEWLWSKEIPSVCSCAVAPETLDKVLAEKEEAPVAVYITSPDYLGGMTDIKKISEVCHKHGTILLVDNAHGAYLHFLSPSLHPMDLGADICCDSAHKTFPVLTGGAYLHIHKNTSEQIKKSAKQAMALFGSTSPSYLILQSLDMCNRYLSDGYKQKLEKIIEEINSTKRILRENGWRVEIADPLKLTITAPSGKSGNDIAELLRNHGMECEYADTEYVVFMVTPENSLEDLKKLVHVLDKNFFDYNVKTMLPMVQGHRSCTIRQAIFSESERIPVEESLGRICGVPLVSCPPAIPIVVSGEVITQDAIKVLRYYDIKEIEVLI